MEPFRLHGAVTQRQFQYLFPIDDQGKQIPFIDRPAWENELKKTFNAQILMDGDGITMTTGCDQSNSDINAKVVEITRKHLTNKSIGGIFWDLVPDDRWKEV